MPPGIMGPPPLPEGELGFKFDRFGVRVPALMISPWIKPKTVFRSLTDDINSTTRTPYDHSSVIKTILNWEKFNIEVTEEDFGKRVLNAPSFESVLNVEGDHHRSDTSLELPEPFFEVDQLRAFEFSALQALLLPLIIAIVDKLDPSEAQAKAEEIIGSSKTITDIHNAITKLAIEGK